MPPAWEKASPSWPVQCHHVHPCLEGKWQEVAVEEEECGALAKGNWEGRFIFHISVSPPTRPQSLLHSSSTALAVECALPQSYFIEGSRPSKGQSDTHSLPGPENGLKSNFSRPSLCASFRFTQKLCRPQLLVEALEQGATLPLPWRGYLLLSYPFHLPKNVCCKGGISLWLSSKPSFFSCWVQQRAQSPLSPEEAGSGRDVIPWQLLRQELLPWLRCQVPPLHGLVHWSLRQVFPLRCRFLQALKRIPVLGNRIHENVLGLYSFLFAQMEHIWKIYEPLWNGLSNTGLFSFCGSLPNSDGGPRWVKCCWATCSSSCWAGFLAGKHSRLKAYATYGTQLSAMYQKQGFRL